ncbi:hypothetical protein E8E15_001170 [Penicillium rubens]|uniref:Pc21g21130 protein n=1 Tax=Penicillium rubens (strain ATCC 28089 / DSM 1075 / NRRL 1951 / Wisconsin 54-1255) TaxID=500485 RepID=B6HLG4_PENRW|nr:uncharacterized protein N7525_006421 [Penicillium rubens]CAP97010.1 Pc21g21130 [Penicillium rubens Wisconsin 54-1255]KAF3008124.1 hypothetical protein E8E15_001170 [Penicillium rubens]KAJ5050098.1 hypothetical protein NUH16_008628 [Penicillium rubens]KAJ5828168.1 hypothetical protein N7525_006421 [Penicillium rubens]KAJ5842081.1 hypothetical protein N7534_011911 [Penicillium rubens]
MTAKQKDVDYDVIIIGAGISGINFAYRLQERNPELSYCILEERHEIGGTWSLFRYPGIRSDSDLFTFGFAWRPWTQKHSIAHGSLIGEYVQNCAVEEGIDKKIKFHHRVDQMSWSTESKTWNLALTVDKTTSSNLQSRFVLLGTGYYDYHQPLQADIPGIRNFTGTLVHPQYWPTGLNYKDKKVVIIGSGATAITLLPNVAKDAGHVTMLQRSPSYILSVSNEDLVEKLIRLLFPKVLARKLIRFKWIIVPLVLVNFCRRFPRLARKLLMILTAKELPKDMPLDPNFTPNYKPWEQRLCMCPESDFYESIRTGKADVKTDTIANVTETTIQLQSGGELHPDIIVTATGLKLCIAGGIEIFVDGLQYHIGENFLWKFAMMDNLPNAVFAFGYTDASWTLGADTTAKLACRLFKKMKKDHATMVVPRMGAEEKKHVKRLPFLNLKATYVREAQNVLPNVGDRSVWKPRSYYWKDLTDAMYGSLQKGLEWIT